MEVFFVDLGRKIGEERKKAGLTQQQCADAAGIDQISLAKIENGERRTTALELTDLADAMGIRAEWLIEDPPPSVISIRNSSDPSKPSSEIDKKLEQVAREAEFVWKKLDAPEALPSLPKLAMPHTPEATEECALKVKELMGYEPHEPAIGLLEHSANIGVLAFTFPLGNEAPVGASLLLSTGAAAVINGNRRLGRRRLTLANEIGHCVFADEHSVDWRVGYSRREGHEAQIDSFARALLLPARLLRSFWLETSDGRSLRAAAVITASNFQVEVATLARRLQELGLIGGEEAAQVRGINTTKADTLDLRLVPTPNFCEVNRPLLPRRYEKAILDAYRDFEMTAARATDLLFDTWLEADLPALPPFPEDAIWELTS